MKRAFQIAGILLIVLIGAGPASAAIGCGLSNAAMGPSCPMGMAEMDADCPMHALAAAGCSSDCCNRTAPLALLVNGIPVKPKLAAPAPLMASFTVPMAAKGSRPLEVLPSFAATSPPRYILLRVFRI